MQTKTSDQQPAPGLRFQRRRLVIWSFFLIFLLVQLAGAIFLVRLLEAPLSFEHKRDWIIGWLAAAATATNLVFWYVLRQNRLRQRIQAQLEGNSARLEEAQRIGRIGNWEWDIGQGALYWSDQAYRIFGRDPDRFKPTYQAFLAAIHPDDRERVKAAVEAAMAGAAPYSLDHRIILPDGSESTVHEQGEVFLNPQGEPRRMAGTVQDISRQKEVEAELRNRMRLLTLNAEFGFALTRGGDSLAKALHACCLALLRHLDAALARIWLVDEEGENLILHASAGLHEELDGECSRVAIGSLTKIGDIALHRQPRISNALLNDPQIKNPAWVKENNLRGFAGHPLILEGKVVGVMAFFTRHPLSETIIGSLTALADIVALGIEKRQAEQQVRNQALIVEQIPDAIVTTDPEGRITTWNQGAVRLFGFTADQTLGRELISLLPDDEHPFFRQQVLAGVAAAGRHQAEINIRRRSGEIRPAWLSLSRFAGGGADPGLIAYLRDLSEEKRHAEEMRLSAKFLDESGEAVVVTDAEARIIKVNRAFERLTGFRREEVLGENPRVFKSGRHEPEFYQRMWESLLTTGHWEGEIWGRRKNSEIYPKWLSISAVTDDRGRTTHYVGISTDLTAVKQSQEKLENLAHYDQLTGLPNRLLLLDRLGQAIERAKMRRQQTALLLFDLDRFKEVNDTLGHSSGDAILADVAQRLRSLAAETDTPCRLGGDEFCLIIPEVGQLDEVVQTAQKVLTAFTHSFTVDNHELYLTPSIGITLFPDDADSVENLLKNADTAMYHAKESGGNSFQFYQESMYQAVLDRMVLKNRLRQALEREEFELYYQPKVTAGSHALCGAEALIRWRHPEDGLISPAAFIPLAEETGLIIPLGEWVIRQACRQSRHWRRLGLPPVRIAVNLSAKQFQLPELAATIARIMREEEMPADLLEMEITESILMDDVRGAIATMTKLKEMGIRLALDDFGTGYSSLSYLKHFPLDALKIDRSFVKDITSDQDDRAVIITIITLAHHLKMQVVAEGVENGEQAAFLRSKGCDIFQGFYFSKPLPARDFAASYLQTRIPAGDPAADF